jgi:hypothetical protein
MSRKWERMIEKNRKQTNRLRGKSGQAYVPNASTGIAAMQAFRGRNWVWPLTLVFIAVFFLNTRSSVMPLETMDYVTAIAYFVLAFIVFLWRRPVLRIGKTQLNTRKFTGEKWVDAEDIEQIVISKSAILIQMKQKRNRWVFTRFAQIFPISETQMSLKEFAENNKVQLLVQ